MIPKSFWEHLEIPVTRLGFPRVLRLLIIGQRAAQGWPKVLVAWVWGRGVGAEENRTSYQ